MTFRPPGPGGVCFASDRRTCAERGTAHAPEYEALDLSGPIQCRSGHLLVTRNPAGLGQRSCCTGFRFGSAMPDRGPVCCLLTGDTSVELSLPPDTRWLVSPIAILEKTFFESGERRHLPSHATTSSTQDGSCDILRHPTADGDRTQSEGPAGRADPARLGPDPVSRRCPRPKQVLIHRTRGRYDAAGARLEEIDDPQSRTPYLLPTGSSLFPLRNPRPDLPLAALRLVSLGPPIILAPSPVSPPRGGPADPNSGGRHPDELDRPVTERLSHRDRPGNRDLPAPRHPRTRHACRRMGAAEEPVRRGWARVSGPPSATIRIRDDDTPVATCRFGDLSPGET